MKNTSTWWFKIPLVFFLIFGLTELVVDSGDIPAFIKFPMVQIFLVFVLFLLIVIAIITRAIENVMYQTLSKEAQERYLAAKNKSLHWKWGEEAYEKMLGSKPLEKEGEIILDHDYDGIRELDNNLPPWWVYLFYASIVFAVVYLVRFEIYNDYNQDQEYEQEVAAAQLEIEEYKKTAKGLVDANTVELLTDAGDLKAGQTIFESNCVACHMADGGGGIGPNLTDQNWILGGGIKNVFHTISEGGRDGKGMIAWKQSLKPAEIAQVASYVLSFQGTTPANPKAPDGDLWVDPDAPAQAVPAIESSTEQEVDSTSVTMN
ncbi:cbb3-type cytochrome c oxidase N-terminal domain-containing protein [Zobellia laminariae]|uniref:cbb3-type cytochrome c oxidase N-terminal domain-containing protein n=1 Tax=Zobellia laminariae TaxID=248906 RepID=UPI0012D89ECD|nr:cbb3-type cytochrome c oxidase N-terminal domain-containing protein [Zobellia laminariae]MUH39063.1 cytochrome C oxidase subunit III [Zobellia laminariae]WKX78421.1 cbb3-type cytochrome c oxidase N-terminal domain-containing protein [Zobellia laminariae]